MDQDQTSQQKVDWMYRSKILLRIMSTEYITVHLKTLAGEILPLHVKESSSLQEISLLASTQYPDQLPPRRTKIIPFSEEDQDLKSQEAVQDGQLLLVVIQDAPTLEMGLFEDGNPYERFAIPFRDQIMYLYMLSYRSRIQQVTLAEYAISLTPDITLPSKTFLRQGRVLYELIRALFPDVTPQEMKELYDIVMPYWQELTYRKGHGFIHTRSPKEPILCDCGSIIQHTSMRTHLKSRKHMASLSQ